MKRRTAEGFFRETFHLSRIDGHLSHQVLVGEAEGLVDFPDEAPFNFCDFLRAHAEDASTLSQFFEVGLDVEPGDIRGERLKRQHVLIS